MIEFISLFLSGFTSATLLPGTSEALFLYLLSQHPEKQWLLLLAVGSGNTLGGMSNWLLGWLIQYGWMKKQPQHDNTYYRRAELWLQRYGAPVLLLSFLPLIGDPLCLLAGLFRISWEQALLFIFLSKFLRYLLLMQVF